MPPAQGLPDEIRARLESHFGSAVTGLAPLGGGEVNHAARVAFRSGDSVFVKWHPDPPPGVFDAEADGLGALTAAAGATLRVPRVLLVSDAPPTLALEYLPPVEPRDADAFSQRFAEALANLHRQTLRTGDGAFGYARDNYLGSQPQTNTPVSGDWAEFYRDYRLAPQMERARRAGRLPPPRERALADLLDRLPDLLDGLPPDASLIHGDLWSGNFLCTTGDEPALIDPAVYFAPREMEIAYVELFGGFPPRFVAHYDHAYPLDAGYRHRCRLHQLYPLLIHLNHFGETYGPRVDAVCREYEKPHPPAPSPSRRGGV